MQGQPRDSRKPNDAKRARQAARLSDDVFKGGAGVATSGGGSSLKSPWHMGAGRLWETARRRSSGESES